MFALDIKLAARAAAAYWLILAMVALQQHICQLSGNCAVNFRLYAEL